MQNKQVKTEECLREAFWHLDIPGKGYSFYMKLVAKAMISDLAAQASSGEEPLDKFHYHDLSQYYGEVLDFLHEVERLAGEYYPTDRLI